MNFDRIILVDKPAGMTSFGVVARVRRRLTEAAGHKVKVGHTGTLDPFATGLLILLSGKMTKKSDEFLKLDKEYEAVIELGVTSSTGDPEGQLTKTLADGQEFPDENAVKCVLTALEGQLVQKPPMYSAVKINGQRAYKIARQIAAKTPDAAELTAALQQAQNDKIKGRTVTIYGLELLEYTPPIMKIRAQVSSGTYIRTLAEEIGRELGTGAYCTALRRTKIGSHSIKDAETLPDDK
jgi:tRNA pseudouridine55 synthase